MELEDFIMTCNLEQVSDSALLKQREKLNPDVFKYLNDDWDVLYSVSIRSQNI